jgi:hypothetical protein
VQSNIRLFVVYFVLVVPVSFVFRVTSKFRGTRPGWQPMFVSDDQKRSASQQYWCSPTPSTVRMAASARSRDAKHHSWRGAILGHFQHERVIVGALESLGDVERHSVLASGQLIEMETPIFGSRHRRKMLAPIPIREQNGLTGPSDIAGIDLSVTVLVLEDNAYDAACAGGRR